MEAKIPSPIARKIQNKPKEAGKVFDSSINDSYN